MESSVPLGVAQAEAPIQATRANDWIEDSRMKSPPLSFPRMVRLITRWTKYFAPFDRGGARGDFESRGSDLGLSGLGAFTPMRTGVT